MFELDEEIQVSNCRDFRSIKEVKFKHQDPDCEVWGVTTNGYIIGRSYARKIQPKVRITIHYDSHQHFCEISKELADKIKAGELK